MGDKQFAFLAGIGYTGSLADKTNAYYTDLIANGGDPNRPSTGQYIPDRFNWATTATNTSGTVYFTYFTSFKDQTISAVTAYTGATAAGATPTVCQYGLYSIASTDDITLLSATTNDTSLFASSSTAYRKALDTPVSLAGGTRYAVGVLVVTGAATPTLVCCGSGSVTVTSAVYATAPRLTGARTGQTSMPSSVTAANIVATGFMRSFLLD